MHLPRVVGTSVLTLATGLAAACGADTFAVALDAGTSDAASDANASDGVASTTCRDPRADPQSSCSLAAPSCARSTLSVPAASAPLAVFDIAYDATHVYWVAQTGYNGVSPGVLYRVPKAGGTTEVMAKDLSGPVSIALDSTSIYVVTTGFDNLTNTILRVKKSAPCTGATCTQPQTIFSGEVGRGPRIHALGEQDLYLIAANAHFRHYFDPTVPSWRSTPGGMNGDPPSGIAGPNGIFVGAGARREIDEISQDGLSARKLIDLSAGDAGAFPGPILLVRDCTSLYAVRDSIGDVLSFPRVGGSLTTVVPGPRTGTYAIAVDETFVYLGVANGPGILRTVKKGGGPLVTVMGGNVWAIAVDDTAVYWGDHDTGVIYRLIK